MSAGAEAADRDRAAPASGIPVPPPPSPWRWIAALALILGLALALRAPLVQQVPHLTDETAEVLFARAIAFEGARPWVHTDAYNGPLWAYLLAGALRLAGSSAALPRQFALLLGLATVAATFGLGAMLGPRDRRLAAATLAGLGLATSFTHALVGSRVAWSNSATPLWTALATLALLAAVRVGPVPRHREPFGFPYRPAWGPHPPAPSPNTTGGGGEGGDSEPVDRRWRALRAHVSIRSTCVQILATPLPQPFWGRGGGGGPAPAPTATGAIQDGPVPNRSGGVLLILAGALAGLALHSHPSVIVYLAALTVWFLLAAERRAWLRSPWPWLAFAAALLAYSPVILFNLREGFRSIAEARASANAAEAVGAATWLAGVAGAASQLGRSAMGGFTLAGPDPAPAARVAAALYSLLLLVGALLAAREPRLPAGRRLPLVVTGTALLALPFFNRNWQGLLEARYLAFTLPPLYAAAGAWLALVWPGGRGRRTLAGLALAALLLLPAARLWMIERQALAEQYDNRRLWAMLARAGADEAGHAGEGAIMVDIALREVPWRAGGHPRRAVEYLLTMEGLPFTRAPEAKINHFLDQGTPLLLFLAGPTAAELGRRHALVPLDVAERPGEGAWGLYAGP